MSINFYFKANDCRQNIESRHLSRILSDMFNVAMELAVQFFKVANTNLLIQSNTISHILAHFGHNLNEHKYKQIIIIPYFLYLFILKTRYLTHIFIWVWVFFGSNWSSFTTTSTITVLSSFRKLCIQVRFIFESRLTWILILT